MGLVEDDFVYKRAFQLGQCPYCLTFKTAGEFSGCFTYEDMNERSILHTLLFASATATAAQQLLQFSNFSSTNSRLFKNC